MNQNFNCSQPATRFPSATDINKLQTVFDEDTIFCKNCNLRFLTELFKLRLVASETRCTVYYAPPLIGGALSDDAV